jgi:capsule polysaccharide export protein KpsE/RkpR
VGIQLKDIVKNQYKLSSGGIKNNSLAELLSVSEQLKSIGKDDKDNSISTLLSEINNYSIEYNKLNVYLDDQIRGWALANNDYQKKLSEYQHKTTFTAIASQPTRPVVASWPKKPLVVLISCLSVLLLSCFYFIFIDKIKLAYEQIASEE